MNTGLKAGLTETMSARLPVKIEIKCPWSVQAAAHQRNFKKSGGVFVHSRSPFIERLSYKLIKGLKNTKSRIRVMYNVLTATKEQFHNHHQTAKKQSTVRHLQLARSWAMHMMSPSELVILGSIHSLTWQGKDLHSPSGGVLPWEGSYNT